MALAERAITDAQPTSRRLDALRILRVKTNQVVLDLLVASAALLCAGWLQPAGRDRRLVTALLLVLWALALHRERLYNARFFTRRSDEVQRIVNATVAGVAGVAVVAFVFRLEVGRVWLGLATLFGVTGLAVERELVRAHYDRLRRSGKLRRRVVMIGDNEESRALRLMFGNDRELGYDVVRTVNPDELANGRSLDRNELTTLVLRTAHSEQATSVVIAASAIDAGASNGLIRDLVEAGIHVELTSTLTDIDPGRLTVRPLGRFPVVYIEPVQRGGWRAVAKRSFDVTLAGFGLLLVAPVAVAIAIAIRAGSPGPIIFRQRRVGQNGVDFNVLKFRTMVTNAEEILAELHEENEGSGPLFKMRNDPRITKIGATLRKTSLDELPQLWNVLRGEMSLVGPRPALASEMAAWDDELYARLRVKPGITGMWQVSGRSETTFEEYTRLDLYYVDNWSLVVDLMILARTIPAVLRSSGAY